MTYFSGKKFDEYVSDEDCIKAEHNGFELIAMVHDDDVHRTRDDDFEPGSCFDPNDPEHGEYNRLVKQTYDDGEWKYVGVEIVVSWHGVELVGDYECALWGIEANWPDEIRGEQDIANFGDNRNHFLVEVANDLAGEALDKARKTLADMFKAWIEQDTMGALAAIHPQENAPPDNGEASGMLSNGV